MGTLLGNGRSWSGHERNVAFLNLGNGQFSDASGVLGLNLDVDGRAVASLDWDGDGDLDLWTSNRTGPRLVLLRNDVDPNPVSVSIRLQGTRSNRDGIGARVELMRQGTDSPVTWRTLRAGEGYLAQSSKTLVIPLGHGASIDHARVQWPGAETELFENLEPGGAYVLEQGTGTARVVDRRTAGFAPDRSSASASADPPSARVIPHAPIPIPLPAVPVAPAVDGHNGDPIPLPVPGARATLLVFWATWCAPCVEELRELKGHADAFQEEGVAVKLINVDDMDTEPDLPARALKIERFFKRESLPFENHFASTALIHGLDALQRTILANQKPISLPSSFLVDREGRLLAHYRGRVDLARALADARTLTELGGPFRDRAVPFPGRWFVNPFPADALSVAEKLLDLEQPELAIDYLDQVSPPILESEPVESPGRLRASDLYFRASEPRIREGMSESAIPPLEKALALDSSRSDARAALALMQHLARNYGEAAAQYRTLLGQKPDHFPAANALAWILATTPDSTVRNPTEAVTIAERIALASPAGFAEPLDTLAAAYAAAGRFAEAVETGERAAAIAREKREDKLAAEITQRTDLYRERRAFVAP